MDSLILPRRRFLQGVASVAIFAPAVVRAPSLMAVSARFCGSTPSAPSWAPRDALAFLQHEMERRFAETLFGGDGLSSESENSVSARSPSIGEAKITALWELRTWFGPRGSPPKRFEELPAEVRDSLFSILGVTLDVAYENAQRSVFRPHSAQKRLAVHLTTPLEAGT
jgi:hypothetical protein